MRCSMQYSRICLVINDRSTFHYQLDLLHLLLKPFNTGPTADPTHKVCERQDGVDFDPSMTPSPRCRHDGSEPSHSCNAYHRSAHSGTAHDVACLERVSHIEIKTGTEFCSTPRQTTLSEPELAPVLLNGGKSLKIVSSALQDQETSSSHVSLRSTSPPPTPPTPHSLTPSPTTTTEDISNMSAAAIASRVSAESIHLSLLLRVRGLRETVAALRGGVTGRSLALDEAVTAMEAIQGEHRQLAEDIDGASRALQGLLRCGKVSSRVARSRDAIANEVSGTYMYNYIIILYTTYCIRTRSNTRK